MYLFYFFLEYVVGILINQHFIWNARVRAGALDLFEHLFCIYMPALLLAKYILPQIYILSLYLYYTHTREINRNNVVYIHMAFKFCSLVFFLLSIVLHFKSEIASNYKELIVYIASTPLHYKSTFIKVS